jgi:hypothetical protein
MLQKIGNCFGASLKILGIVLGIPLNFRNGSELILLFWDILENLRNSFGNSWKIWGIALGSSQKAQRKRLRHLLMHTCIFQGINMHKPKHIHDTLCE